MSSTGCYEKDIRERIGYFHTQSPFTRFVAYPDPLFPSPYQLTASLSLGPCFLSEQSSLVTPIGRRAIQALVELVSEVTQLMRLLVPATACEVHPPLFRSQGMLPVLTVSVGGTRPELARLEVDLSAVVEFAGTVVSAVGIAVVVVVAPGLDEIGGSNHFVMTQGTSAGSSGPQWGSVTAKRRDSAD